MKKCVETEAELESVLVTMDAEAREVMMFGQISQETASRVILAIRQLDRDSKANINLIISSTGGDEGGGWAIYDALCLTRSKIIGNCFGECMSIAALVLQGCDTRLLSPNCRFMIHNGSFSIESQPLEKVRAAVGEENILTQMYYEKLAERSEISVDKVKQLCNNEAYMSAEVAVGYGFADGILGQTKNRRKK